jgi:ketosteroid isomerase-like protein
MSRENVEVVKAVFQAWDEGGVEGILRFLHDDIEYLPQEEGGAIHGHDGIRRYFHRWMEPWDEFHVRPTEFRDVGDCVLNGAAMRGRGRGSGIEVTMRYWSVWLIRGGRVARWEEYAERTEALTAVGLRE